MMKRVIPIFLLFTLNTTVSLAGYADGYITAGEYEYGVEVFGENSLFIEGGGADRIEAWNYSYLEVQYTSTPLSNNSGIWDIVLYHNSNLLYLGGITEEITLYKNATANLYGGRIDYISSFQYATTEHINIYCQTGWSWLYGASNKIVGITGLWKDGSDFTIHFTSNGEAFGADPVWMNVHVIPEPATLALLGVGGLLLRKRKQ